MKDTGKLKVTAQSEREIVMTRDFDAPRRLVFDALTKPELLKRWLGVFGGWELAVCEVDLKVGGTYRYVWRRSSDGSEMGVRGVYREIVPPERLVCTELFDEAWYPGESLITTTLAEQGGRTTFTSTILYESQEARDAVLKSPMERGVAASYNKLAELLENA
ncbi:MAG: ATPase [Acidobacteria bacterium]|nr:MAG: ATPase [Acidobacteriota bacterium]